MLFFLFICLVFSTSRMYFCRQGEVRCISYSWPRQSRVEQPYILHGIQQEASIRILTSSPQVGRGPSWSRLGSAEPDCRLGWNRVRAMIAHLSRPAGTGLCCLFGGLSRSMRAGWSCKFISNFCLLCKHAYPSGRSKVIWASLKPGGGKVPLPFRRLWRGEAKD